VVSGWLDGCSVSEDELHFKLFEANNGGTLYHWKTKQMDKNYSKTKVWLQVYLN